MKNLNLFIFLISFGMVYQNSFAMRRSLNAGDEEVASNLIKSSYKQFATDALRQRLRNMLDSVPGARKNLVQRLANEIKAVDNDLVKLKIVTDIERLNEQFNSTLLSYDELDTVREAL